MADNVDVFGKPIAKNRQIGGDHYSKMKLQPNTYIMENELNWCQGNVIKYITRYPFKHDSFDKQIEDLEKAKHYIDLEIERLQQLKFEEKLFTL